MTSSLITLLTGTLTICAALTGMVRRAALRKGIMDVPNSRSSHTQPTPRGGGLAIVGAIVISTTICIAFGLLRLSHLVIAMSAGLAVAAVGWLDDRYHLPARSRALVHLVSAVWCVFWLGGMSSLRIGAHTLGFNWFGSVVAVIGVVWLTNLYNFMDGLDGLSGSEAVFVAAIGGYFAYRAGLQEIAFLSWIVASASLGFLLWNWPPAKIFMGDVASGFLGFIFATLALASENTGGPPLSIWILLLGVFVVDATATLIRRVLQGERWHEPHRSHAYQLAVGPGGNHVVVTVAVIALDFVLAILAFLALSFMKWSTIILLGTCGALIALQLFIVWRNGMLLAQRSIPGALAAEAAATKSELATENVDRKNQNGGTD